MEYTNIQTIENYLLTEIDLSFQDQVKDWIKAMSAFIEKETGRVFIADTEASVRKYDGDGTDSLIIDDCIEIETVKVDNEEVDFLVYPANKTPYTTIKLEDGYFTDGYQNVEVTAKWGYSENVPEDIKFVATVLVAGIIQHSLAHEGEVSSMTMGRYTVSYKNDRQLKDYEQVVKILEDYRRYNEI
jgi:uncharacterized protein YunC (DUF1805 family)